MSAPLPHPEVLREVRAENRPKLMHLAKVISAITAKMQAEEAAK